MAAEVMTACEEIDDDPSVGPWWWPDRRAFCAGGDRATLGGRRAAEDPDAIGELRSIYDVFVRVGALRAPTIAAVHGAAVGAGLNLVSHRPAGRGP